MIIVVVEEGVHQLRGAVIIWLIGLGGGISIVRGLILLGSGVGLGYES